MTAAKAPTRATTRTTTGADRYPYPLDMFIEPDPFAVAGVPPEDQWVRTLLRGRTTDPAEPVVWTMEMRDTVPRSDAARLMRESPEQWTLRPDDDGWLFAFHRYPEHRCHLGCDEPPLMEVFALRWVPAETVRADQRYIAGRVLGVAGTATNGLPRPGPDAFAASDRSLR